MTQAAIYGIFLVSALLAGMAWSLLLNRRLRRENRELRQSNKELAGQGEQYRALVDFSPLPLLITQEERIIFVNPAAIDLIGAVSSDEIIGSSPNQWLHPDVAEKAFQRRRQVLETRKTVEPSEMIIIRKDGRKIDILANSSFIRHLGKPAILSSFQDITKYKISEGQAREAVNRFEILFNNAPMSYQSLDEDGNFIEVNKAWLEVMGYTREEVVGRNFSEFLHPDWQDHFKENFPRFKAVGEVLGVEFEMLKKDGSYILVSFHGKIGHTPEGGFQQTHCVFRDITEQNRLENERTALEEKLKQAQKMEAIGTLAGGIAHDFNNILFPILGHSEMLLDDIRDDSPVRDSLNEIYTGALRARDLVHQILAFARREKTEFELIKIQPVIKEALKLIRSSLPATISIEESLESACGPVKADPTQVHQIVMNLCTNAYHAMTENGGELKIALKQMELGRDELNDPELHPGLYACLAVADTGEGIHKDVIGRIFEPYFTTKGKGKGTGMGLSVVHGIVKAMNGAIQVYSEPGRGSEFRVYLPIAESLSKTLEPVMEKPVQGGCERILLVDDEVSIIEMEKQALVRLGYEVTARTGSLEALEDFRADPDQFDLVVTDMAMPHMPGDKLAVELIRIRPDIPIFLCTGFSETLTEEKIKSLGIRELLKKPIMMKDLAQKIREVLDF